MPDARENAIIFGNETQVTHHPCLELVSLCLACQPFNNTYYLLLYLVLQPAMDNSCNCSLSSFTYQFFFSQHIYLYHTSQEPSVTML